MGAGGEMKSNGTCLGCMNRREDGEMPCNHPAVAEEMRDVMVSDGMQLHKAYGRIRERLGLRFDLKSWNVAACKGKVNLGIDRPVRAEETPVHNLSEPEREPLSGQKSGLSHTIGEQLSLQLIATRGR